MAGKDNPPQPAPAVRPAVITVRATKVGAYPSDTLRFAGQVFVIDDEKHFSTNWMVKVPAGTPVSKQAKPSEKMSEAVARLRPGGAAGKVRQYRDDDSAAGADEDGGDTVAASNKAVL